MVLDVGHGVWQSRITKWNTIAMQLRIKLILPLVISLLVVVFWYMLCRYLYDGYYRLSGIVPDFRLAEHLTKRDNPALAIQFAAFVFSIGLITRGSLQSLPIEYDKLGEYFYTFFAYQVARARLGRAASYSASHLP